MKQKFNRDIIILIISIILIFALTFFIYNINFRTITNEDNYPTVRLPISIFQFHRLNLDNFYPKLFIKSDNLPYYLRAKDGHIYAEKTTGMALFISPIYYIIFKNLYEGNLNLPYALEDTEFLNYLMISEKLTASFIASLTVCIIFLVCFIIFEDKIFSIFISLLYAFGTNHWVTSSQGLWVHGGVEFWLSILILGILLFEKTNQERYLYLTSFSAGMVSIIRLDGLIYFLIVLLYIIRYHQNKIHKYLSFSSIIIIFYYTFNLIALGSFIGGYGNVNIKPFYLFPLKEIILAFLGMFISPGRGLFFYTPILILSFVGIYFLIKIKKDYPKILIYLLPAVATIVFIHTVYTDNPNYLKWYGGGVWGPRYFTDVLPLLILYFGISIKELIKLANSRVNKKDMLPILYISIALLTIFSIFTQYVGAFYYKDYWNTNPNIDENPERVWNLYENPIVVELKTGAPQNPGLYYLINWHGYEISQGYPMRWMSNNATIKITEKKDFLSFNIVSFYKPRIVQIYLNDILIHRQIIQTDFVRIEIPIKLKDGTNFLRFYTPDGCQRPIDIPQFNNKDSRCLSFAFQNITLY